MTRNKSIYIKIFPVCLILCISSCKKQLDLTPKTVISDANFWHSPNDLALACNYLYNFLPGLGTSDPTGAPTPYQDTYSDDATSVVPNQISDGSRLAPATSNEWTNYYRLIRAANNILEKSLTVTGDASTINKYLGEAHFFRALGYFELVKRFGNVPLISKTLTLEDTLLFSHRTDREIVIDSIYADLDYAGANCPLPSAQPGSEYGRITATAAWAYKSRVALFEGTWDKFHSEGNAAKHLQIAVDASQAVIGTGYHTLFVAKGDSSYYYLFLYAGEGPANKENILVRLYGQNIANNISSHSYGRSFLDQGVISATKTFMDTYLFTDGLPQGKSPYDSSANQTSTLTKFRNRDPRAGMTIFNRTDPYPTIVGILPYAPGLVYRIRKYYPIEDYTPNVSFIDFIVIRYAEVLLNNAEAKYELNGSISDADLNQTINLIRARVNMPALTNSFASANGLDVREEIRRERRIELSFEGFHYWDLLRWKTAETALPPSVLGTKYFPDEMMGVPTANRTPDGYAILESASKRQFSPQRDYLWPLPTKELGLNSNLSQNPNW